jgi:uncharacterized protein YfbU (UPF0304 family)
MELTKKDRLLLINQYRILAALNKDEESYYKELIEVLERGYSIFYSLVDEWVSEDMPEAAGKFVLDILDLYRALEDLKRSTKDERLMKNPYSYFSGFDGINETQHMGFCRFLVEKQGKFQEQKPYLLKTDNMNSHMPMIAKYERMLAVAATLSSIWDMSVEDALKILEA